MILPAKKPGDLLVPSCHPLMFLFPNIIGPGWFPYFDTCPLNMTMLGTLDGLDRYVNPEGVPYCWAAKLTFGLIQGHWMHRGVPMAYELKQRPPRPFLSEGYTVFAVSPLHGTMLEIYGDPGPHELDRWRWEPVLKSDRLQRTLANMGLALRNLYPYPKAWPIRYSPAAFH